MVCIFPHMSNASFSITAMRNEEKSIHSFSLSFDIACFLGISPTKSFPMGLVGLPNASFKRFLLFLCYLLFFSKTAVDKISIQGICCQLVHILVYVFLQFGLNIFELY